MTERLGKPAKRVLDIGGGPDWEELKQGKNNQEYIRGAMRSLRVATLAKANPKTEHYVLDPYLPESAAAELHKELPNVHFVVGKADKKDFIPFANNIFDSVELNFVFTPMTMHEMKPDNKEDERAALQRYMQWSEKTLIQEEEIPLYINTLREAARTLKPAGILSLCEKKQRMDRIIRLLSSDESNKLDGQLLREFNLKYKSTTEISDSNRSRYAFGAVNLRNALIQRGDEKGAEESKILLVEFEKVGAEGIEPSTGRV